MLTPQPYFQQICQQCGRLPAYRTAVCPSCGTRLSLPWPSQSHGPHTFTPVPLVVLPPQSPASIPFIIELLLNVLGVYGVGWLMLGNIVGGLTLLLGSLILWPVVALLSIFTMGLGLVCLAPLAFGAMIGNLLLLQRATRLDALEKQRRTGNISEKPTFTSSLTSLSHGE